MKLKKILFPIIALALVASSCASYRTSPLCDLCLLQTSSKKEEISIVAKTFTKADCKKFFDRNVIAKGYQPVQLYIENNSNQCYLFSLSHISLPIARPEEVAEKVHTSTAGRVIGYGAGALALEALFAFPAALSDAPVHAPTELLFIPAVVDGVKSSEANTALDADFATKAAKNKVILPHSRLNGVIFIPVDAFQDFFTLTLIEQESKQPKTFNITSQKYVF